MALGVPGYGAFGDPRVWGPWPDGRHSSLHVVFPQEPRGLGAASAPLSEAGVPRRFRRAAARGEAAEAVQELARALAHLLEAERQERARAEAQEAEDQQARVLAQLLRVWGAPRTTDPAPGLEDDPDAPAAQLARALLRARLDPAALAAQLVPAPVPAAALRPRPPIYDDGPAGPEAEDAGDDTSDVDPELLRLRTRGWAGACIPGEHVDSGTLGGREALDQGVGIEMSGWGTSKPVFFFGGGGRMGKRGQYGVAGPSGS